MPNLQQAYERRLQAKGAEDDFHRPVKDEHKMKEVDAHPSTPPDWSPQTICPGRQMSALTLGCQGIVVAVSLMNRNLSCALAVVC